MSFILIIIGKEGGGSFHIVDNSKEAYNYITTVISSQPENQRNTAGRSLELFFLPFLSALFSQRKTTNKLSVISNLRT